MASLKDRISSPLEAGQSIHDAHHLPPNLTQALEYVSKCLARKAHHVTLAVVRKDYQLPATATIPPPSPALSSPPTSPGMMPSPSRLAFTRPTSKLRSLVRSTKHPILNHAMGPASPGIRRSATGSPTYPDSVSPRLRWPLSPGSPNSMRSYPSTPGTPGTLPPTPRSILGSVPATPRSPPYMNPLTANPPTPRTPATPATVPPTPGTPAQSNDVNTIKLVYAMAPNRKADKAVRQAIEKAEKKFGITASYVPLQSHNLPADLLRRSLLQNEVLFSSEGITLLSLDRLYTFKAAMATYTRSPSTFRLEDAVDELRRLVLASRRHGNGVIGGADEHGRVSRSFLMRSYDFLGVTSKAMRDVERAYARVYRSDRDEEEKSKGGVSGNIVAERERKTSASEEESETTPTQAQLANVSMPPPPPPLPVASFQQSGACPADDRDDIPEPMSPLKEPRMAPVPPSIHLRRKASPLPPTVSIPPTPIDGLVQQNWEIQPRSPRQPMSPTSRVASPQQLMSPTSRVASPQQATHTMCRVASPRQPMAPMSRPPTPSMSQVALPQQSPPQISRVASPKQPMPQISSRVACPQQPKEREPKPATEALADSPQSFNIPIIIPPTATLNMAHRPVPDPLSPIERVSINIPSPLASPGKGPALKLQTTFPKSLPPLPLQPKSPRDSEGGAGNEARSPREDLSHTTSNPEYSASSPTPITSSSLEAPIVMSVPSPTAASYGEVTFPLPQQQQQQQQQQQPATTVITTTSFSSSPGGLIRPIARPSAQMPIIKIDTSVATATAATTTTARRPAPARAARWNGGGTIDSILCPTNDGEGFPISAHPDRMGPMTPNGYDDISPITRGEWGMLMFGDGMKGRTVAVETC